MEEIIKKPEIWLPVQGFELRFKISNWGRVISFDGRYTGEKILSPAIDNVGYYQCQLRDGKLNKRIRVHTLVALHFIGAKPPGRRMSVNHIDGVKTNNYFENLEWLETGDNIRHAISIGLMDNRGVKNKGSKLTEEKVLEMRRLYATGNYSHQKISEMFNVCRRQAGDVINGVNWGWLKESQV